MELHWLRYSIIQYYLCATSETRKQRYDGAKKTLKNDTIDIRKESAQSLLNSVAGLDDLGAGCLRTQHFF